MKDFSGDVEPPDWQTGAADAGAGYPPALPQPEMVIRDLDARGDQEWADALSASYRDVGVTVLTVGGGAVIEGDWTAAARNALAPYDYYADATSGYLPWQPGAEPASDGRGAEPAGEFVDAELVDDKEPGGGNRVPTTEWLSIADIEKARPVDALIVEDPAREAAAATDDTASKVPEIFDEVVVVETADDAAGEDAAEAPREPEVKDDVVNEVVPDEPPVEKRPEPAADEAGEPAADKAKNEPEDEEKVRDTGTPVHETPDDPAARKEAEPADDDEAGQAENPAGSADASAAEEAPDAADQPGTADAPDAAEADPADPISVTTRPINPSDRLALGLPDDHDRQVHEVVADAAELAVAWDKLRGAGDDADAAAGRPVEPLPPPFSGGKAEQMVMVDDPILNVAIIRVEPEIGDPRYYVAATTTPPETEPTEGEAPAARIVSDIPYEGLLPADGTLTPDEVGALGVLIALGTASRASQIPIRVTGEANKWLNATVRVLQRRHVGVNRASASARAGSGDTSRTTTTRPPRAGTATTGPHRSGTGNVRRTTTSTGDRRYQSPWGSVRFDVRPDRQLILSAIAGTFRGARSELGHSFARASFRRKAVKVQENLNKAQAALHSRDSAVRQNARQQVTQLQERLQQLRSAMARHSRFRRFSRGSFRTPLGELNRRMRRR